MKKKNNQPTTTESKFLEDHNSVFSIPLSGFLNKHQSAKAAKEKAYSRQIQRGQLFCF